MRLGLCGTGVFERSSADLISISGRPHHERSHDTTAGFMKEQICQHMAMRCRNTSRASIYIYTYIYIYIYIHIYIYIYTIYIYTIYSVSNYMLLVQDGQALFPFFLRGLVRSARQLSP